MPMSNYPGGFKHGVSIEGIPYHMAHSGKTFWVDENASSTGHGTQNNPLKSIDDAMGKCLAGRGDLIIVKPGHIENISAAGDLACDVIGVTIVGTGTGDDQAKITFDTADTASVTVTVANVTFDNMWFECNFANVDGAIAVAAGGDYFTIKNSRFTNSTTTKDFENVIALADGANYFSFIDNDVHMIAGSDTEAFVATVGESLGMRVIGNNIIGEFSTSIFDIDATAITGAPLFRDNLMINLTVAANFCVEIDGATVALFCNENYGCAGDDLPVAASTASFFVNCNGVDALDAQSRTFPKTATAWP